MHKEKRYKKVTFRASDNKEVSAILDADSRQKIRKLQKLSEERGFEAVVIPCDKLGKEVPALVPTVKKKEEPKQEPVPVPV